MKCVDPGETNADIAGLGITLAFAIQAFISMVLSVCSYALRDGLERRPETDEDARRRYQRVRRRIDAVLGTISDTQTITGVALLLSGLIQRTTLDLYHFHIIYDTVNFTAVSFCAAIICSFAHEEERRTSRFLGIFVFSVLYLAFVIIFGVNLSHWNWDKPGACYNSSGIAASNASHPYVDRIYLGLTCMYMYSVMICCLMFFGDIPERGRRSETGQRRLKAMAALFRFYRFSVMVVAMMQFPLHLYNVFALRSANQHLLSGDPENSWGFGQIVALIMVVPVLTECCRGVQEYKKDPVTGGGDISSETGPVSE